MPVRSEDLVQRAEAFADALRAQSSRKGAPVGELAELGRLGLLRASLPHSHGGAGLGTEAGGHAPLLHVLAAIGGGNLPLGRLYEGHVNALILVHAFGTDKQLANAAEAAEAGLVFGVWNTGGAEPLRLAPSGGRFVFRGGKRFASGAAFVQRPIVTAELDGAGWQMTLPRMEAPEVASSSKLDHDSWEPLGMEASESFDIKFTSASVESTDLIGKPGDFYRDPLFRGGAIRFAAVQGGAVLRLQRMFAGWLDGTGRGEDPYQLARLGEGAVDARECALWIEHAACVAEQDLHVAADTAAIERMVDCANMMRTAVERIASRTVERTIRGVGARGLLRPAGFEGMLRDLLMYLRQPAPDQTLADVGRAALRKKGQTL